jgi:hypothetical protein
MPIILATWRAEMRRISVVGQLKKTVYEIPISKINREKWTGDVAQALEHLLCKHEAKFKPWSHEKK